MVAAILAFLVLSFPPGPAAPAVPDPACVARCTAAALSATCSQLCEMQAAVEQMQVAAERDTARDLDAQPHECERGYVTPIVEDTVCPLPLTEPWVWQRSLHSRTYVRGPDGPVCRRRVEFWTDWPECGGTPLPPAIVITVP